MILRVRRCRKKQLGRVFATCKRDLKTEERRATLCDTLLDQIGLHFGSMLAPKGVPNRVEIRHDAWVAKKYLLEAK